ncbi:MAG TPA: TonB-dependent receptor [Sphingomicrobium sp.]
MFAAAPPAVVAPAEAADEQDVIEIVGRRSDQALKIDRRSYRVQQTPHSAQKDGIQLVRGLPAVTVTPDDQIMLLGSPSVTIFVDGRRYLGDPIQYLRTLHGSDIERIEVITNPSAQYSAEGTGGIINFVLRKKQGEGVSGSTTAEVTNLGHGRADTTVKVKKDKWTYEFEGHAAAGKNSRSTYHKLRSTEENAGEPATINTEDGRRTSRGWTGSISAKATYEIDPKTSISARLWGGRNEGRSSTDADFVGLTPDFASFSEHQRFGNSTAFIISELNFDHKGSKEGETLTASFRMFGNPREHETNAADFSDGSAFSVERHKHLLFAIGQADWQHPMGKGQILSIGAIWNYAQMKERYSFTSTRSDGSLGTDAFDQSRGVDSNLGAYATFQQPIGTWTVMPGVRIETDSRRITSPGHPEVEVAHTDLFPTLHVQHPLSSAFDLTFSYSKRIDRPQLDDLRPYPIVDDVLTIKQGNPHLKDQSTDAFELNLHYHRKKLDAGIIIYDRETSRLWASDYTVVDGINVFTIVNSGHRSDRGAEIDVSTPIVRNVKLNASVNLFDERTPIDSAVGAASEHRFRYTTNATLEWDGPNRGETPGDVAQLQWIYSSPSHEFQIQQHAWNWLSLSYTHSISPKLSLTATMNYQARSRHRLEAPLVQEDYSQREPVEFRLRLLKTFGNP